MDRVLRYDLREEIFMDVIDFAETDKMWRRYGNLLIELLIKK